MKRKHGFYMICGVAIHKVNSLEVTLILHTAHIVTSKSVRPMHMEIGFKKSLSTSIKM